MYKNKKDVDIHVEKLMSKLSLKDFKARAYSVARLYFDVGDYGSCQKYVEQYLTHKANNAAAHKLLGQTFRKMGLKDKALEQFKISLDLDTTQTSNILDICELLVDDDITIDTGRAKYWCDKAEAMFPKHPVTFKLREKLLAVGNSDPEAIIKLLTSELSARPKDAQLHFRLLKHYLDSNKAKEAFDHSCNIEFVKPPFLTNFTWYETLSEVLKHKTNQTNDWLYQLLLLTVKERLSTLSLTEVPQGQSKSLIECNELLYDYDQSIGIVAKAGPAPGFAEFHTSLLNHHRGQLAFLAATFILKKAKKDQLNWHDASKLSSLLMLISWQTVPMDPNVSWLTGASEKARTAVLRWYLEGAYRCSQAGYYVLINNQDKVLLNHISQFCSALNWKDKLYDNIFASGEKRSKANSFLNSDSFNAPALRLPRKIEIQAYDSEAQKQYPNSLHHFVWILLNYNKFEDFKCTIFDMLSSTMTTCGPETLNKLDILAFLYSAAFTAKIQKDKTSYNPIDMPSLLPANITDLLCSLSQMKWWDCAYKFSQNELGSELTDIRSTLSRGIEVVRCIDNHGLDPQLLCILGRTFSKLSELESIDTKYIFESRAKLYYASAIPLLEKLKSKSVIKLPSKRLFDYTHKELDSKEINSLLQESKLFIALKHYNECEYVKAIELLSDLKTAESFYYLSESYKKLAEEETCTSKVNENNSKYVTLLGKAKHYAFKSLEILKEQVGYKTLPLYSSIQDLIDNIETCLSKIDTNYSVSLLNDGEGRYSSDENVSELDNVAHIPKSISQFRNLSSTPKQSMKHMANMNSTNYRTALDSQVFDTTHVDQQFLDRIEKQIKHLQKRDSTMDDFMEQTRNWFDENRKLSNQIINKIHSNIENTTEQFKLLKISVDQVKEQVAECRNEYKDVADLKKQIAELKKEVNKLKKSSSEQTIDESDLYNLDEEYRSNDNASTFGAQIPFAPTQVMPPFTQRLVPPFPVPPNPYHLYGQNLYNLYNQYSQLTQNSSVPGGPTMFEPNRPSVPYPGVYQTPDQMYLDVAHLVQPTIPPAPAVAPTIPNIPAVSHVTAAAVSSSSVASSKATSYSSDVKITSRSLPVNVVITSSDPLPTCTTAPAPVLSVTIPQKHIKGSPHNYQIPMPFNNESKSVAPPVFNFPSSNTSTAPNATSSSTILSSWNKPSTLMPNQNANSNFAGINDSSKSVVDGTLTSASPNTSLNKSRTLSERSNTSIENYDPCPDFKPIIPLPAEVKVTTGEENETAIFCARAKLFRFTDKQWKERGIGEMKLLKHNITGKVRVLMRREQVHKICANHIIVPEMEIKPMKNETKAYFWVANDFAEETVILEKFCIRFKSADIAKNFYETFEKARLASSNSPDSIKKIDESSKALPIITTNQTSIPKTSEKPESNENQAKTVIGGFTFNTTPTFKTVPDVSTVETKAVEPVATKASIFSGLTFKTSTTSPFSNVFSSTPNQKLNVADDSASKINTSDTVEEFEPNVEFKPVVPLPALVDQKTGEEDETILFEHRAKLLRFDGSTKEWKERGLGNIKLLVHKENNQKLRLLMRREQIMKVCCNHAITKEMSFQKMPNMDKAVTWCAKDFSEGELVPETFCLRFKTVQTCNDFMDAVKTAQSKLGDEMKAAKEEKNIAQQNIQTGFGDQFKQKPGSWECKACYTNNLESFSKCACCENPKPEDKKPNATSSWGDKFKPKPGTWECKQCLIRNQADSVICNACNSPNDSNAVKPDANVNKENVPKFSFGITPQASITKGSTNNAPVTSGWGDKFKPKEGTWECKQCFVRNEKTADTCTACNSPKDPNAVSTEVKSVFGSTPLPKFTFGIPQKTAEQKNVPAPTLFNTNANASQTFKFGISQGNDSAVKAFGDTTTNTFATNTQKTTNDSEAVVNLSLKKNENESTPKTPLLPTPSTNAITFGSKQGGTFDFAFKPKSPTKGKSPVKSPKSVKGDESGDDEYASEDEGANIHFNPVIPMPDKIEVVTGEENEEELFGHRAKLFIFNNGEWKERGIGIIKILKHKDDGKLRVLMRREQVHKICLNHILSPDVVYKTKDEKTWLFAANDYSDGDLSLQRFCLRFQNKTIAQQFKENVDQAIKNKYGNAVEVKNVSNEKDADDVIFVSETQASTEDKQKARDLMLPENFYTYKNKNPCEGCRGCRDEKDEQSEQVNSKSQSGVCQQNFANISTPLKDAASNSQTTSSVYGTPSNMDKTTDSFFQTPLSTVGSKTDNSSPSSLSETLTGSKLIFGSPFNQQSMSESNANEKNAIKPVTFMSSGFVQGSMTASKGSILAAPKFNALNTSGDSKPATIFGSTEPKNVFGAPKTESSIFSNSSSGTSNTSIFKTTANKTNDAEVKSIFSVDEQKPASVFSGAPKTENLFASSGPASIFKSANQPASVFSNASSLSSNTSIFKTNKNNDAEVKSIFSSDDQKPVNLFSGAAQGSLFGSTVLQSNEAKPGSGIFGQTSTFAFGNNNQKVQDDTKFGANDKCNTTQKSSIFSGQESVIQPGKDTPSFASLSAKTADKTENCGSAPGEALKVPDTGLSFAALSSSSSEFAIQKKPDFKWEGAGQQLFATASGKQDGGEHDKSGASAAGDEEYDPHYEPIVPLPDKIVVTTGEEDEEKLFGERCKLYRYDEKSREWKERGIGEMKILYHPERKTYRLLLRREQVHKAVLNMLIFMDLELLPMKNSDRAWTWAGRNYADSAGEQETLAVRFKSVELANQFRDEVLKCVHKLQVAAAEAIRKEKEAKENPAQSIPPLRLPKHLEEGARADASTAACSDQSADNKQNGISQGSDSSAQKQVHFEEQQENDDEDEDYEHDYEEEYYNEEEEEESAVYYACDGEVVIDEEGTLTNCKEAHVQVLFDNYVCSPKIQLTDAKTGEILADMLIHTDTEFQIIGDTCSWTGVDYTRNTPVEKKVTIHFSDSETTMEFYDSCETSKASTYVSNDPES